VEVANVGKHSCDDGPHVGEFTPKEPGTLYFKWTNDKSMMRGKSVRVRVKPDHLFDLGNLQKTDPVGVASVFSSSVGSMLF
jgi:hypothetical protein